MATGVTYSELMHTTSIIGIVNRIQTPLTLFQDFFGRRSGDNRNASESVYDRVAGWDIFDSTRRFAGARAPDNGPHRVQKRKIGHQTSQLMHTHESIMIHDNKIFGSRGLGNSVGSMVDMRGQQYMVNQVRYMMDRYRNQREWMYSRMMRGGFNMKPVHGGDNYALRNFDASAPDGEIPINYQIPDSNKGRLALGDGGANILTSWANPGADIIGQLLQLNKAFTRIHGRALKHIFINSTTYNDVQNNLGLQNIGGDAFTVFKSLTQDATTSREGIQNTGFDVVFRALPLFVFHVYDGVLSVDGEADGTSEAENELLIPNGRAIFCPEPDSDWEGLIDGSEIVLPNPHDASYEVQGFASWATRIIDPPAYELKFVDNYLPVLYIPTCIAYGDVS